MRVPVERAVGAGRDTGLVSTPIAPPEGQSDELLPGSIESHLVTEVPMCTPTTSAGELCRSMLGRSYASAADVAVCEVLPDGSQRLVGLVPLSTALEADPSTPVGEVMDDDPPVVAPGLSQEGGGVEGGPPR